MKVIIKETEVDTISNALFDEQSRKKQRQNRIPLAVFHNTGILLAIKATDQS